MPSNGPVTNDGQRSKQKGRRGKRQPMENSYQNLMNLQLQGCMAPRNTRMAAGNACMPQGGQRPFVLRHSAKAVRFFSSVAG